MSQPKTEFKRRNFYIDKDFQNRFIVQFCLLVTLGSVGVMAAVYWLARHSTTIAIAKGHVGVHSTADYLLPLLSQTILIQIVIVALAAAGMTLMVSHKIAGPLYRLKMMFQSLAQGDVSQPMHLRQGDQLQPVAEEYTKAIKQLDEKIKQAKEAAQRQNLDDVKKILATFKTS